MTTDRKGISMQPTTITSKVIQRPRARRRSLGCAASAGLVLASIAALSGCGNNGSMTNDRNTLAQSPNSSIAGPANGDLTSAAYWTSVQEADFVPRETFGTQLAVTGPASLAY